MKTSSTIRIGCPIVAEFDDDASEFTEGTPEFVAIEGIGPFQLPLSNHGLNGQLPKQLDTKLGSNLMWDFATIFAQLWYRDFPLRQSSRLFARRADWTTHIGITVRAAADLMGLYTRFESGGRTDAVLRNNKGKPVAPVEWEWAAVHKGHDVVNEFNKLKKGCVEGDFKEARFACLIDYARSGKSAKGGNFDDHLEKVLKDYTDKWQVGLPPLLLILVHFEAKGKRREFTKLTIREINGGRQRLLREQNAYPWDVDGSRWQMETRENG